MAVPGSSAESPGGRRLRWPLFGHTSAVAIGTTDQRRRFGLYRPTEVFGRRPVPHLIHQKLTPRERARGFGEPAC